MNRYTTPFFLLWLMLSLPGHASPTSEDFRQCHSVASAMLKNCLDGLPGATNQAQQTCWREARAAKNHCYRQVQKRYQQDSSLQKAKRLAQANATKAAAQTSAQ